MKETHGGTVVNLLSNVDTDVVQFSLSDILHRPHDVRNRQSAVITAPPWFFLLKQKKKKKFSIEALNLNRT